MFHRPIFGTYVGTGAAINVELGFEVGHVEVFNETDGDERWEWQTGMTAGHAMKIAADGTSTKITSNGVSRYAGVDGATGIGLTFGSALSESGKTFRYKVLAVD